MWERKGCRLRETGSETAVDGRQPIDRSEANQSGQTTDPSYVRFERDKHDLFARSQGERVPVVRLFHARDRLIPQRELVRHLERSKIPPSVHSHHDQWSVSLPASREMRKAKKGGANGPDDAVLAHRDAALPLLVQQDFLDRPVVRCLFPRAPSPELVHAAPFRSTRVRPIHGSVR